MKTKIDRKKDGTIKIEARLDQEEFKPYFEQALKEALGKLEIKGFRKGQAPPEMAGRYINKETVFKEAAERAVRMSIKKISEENDWTVIAPPQAELKEDKEGLSFEAILITWPEIKLGDYKKIAIVANQELKERLKRVEVTEKEVAEAVSWLVKSRQDQIKNQEGKESKKEGEELTDELAQTMGNFKTATELMESIREGIKAEKIVREADHNRAKILEEIIKDSQVEPPMIVVEKMANNMEEDLKASLERGKLNYDDYVRKHYQSEIKLREALKERAIKEIKAHLTLDRVFQEEKLTIGEEEVEQEMNRVFATQPESEKGKINLQQLKEWSYGNLKNKKVFERLESF